MKNIGEHVMTEDEIIALQEHNEELAKALEFYATAWEGHSGDSGPGGNWPADPEGWPSEALLDDFGRYAQRVLAKHKALINESQ